MALCPSCEFDNQGDSNYCSKCGFEIYSATGRISPDTLLEGRYLIVETIGRGGMGAVYKALDMRLENTPVALKEMSTSALGQGKLNEAVEAFKKEASMLIKLRHPALPRITDYFSNGDDRWYIVMDYIEGETLESIAQKRGPIPEDELIDWAKQICGVLYYLHNQEPPVIFRDLKPANIMLTPNNEIKLIDFGIARHFKPGTTSDTTHYASLGFSPPEQYGEGQTDPRSDIYSLGATMHYLLTGLDPGKNPFKFNAPLDYGYGSKLFSNLIMQCLNVDIEKRSTSVKDIFDLLDNQSSLATSISVEKVPIKSETVAISSNKQTMALKERKIKKGNNIKPKHALFLIIGILFFSTISIIGFKYLYPLQRIELDHDNIVIELGIEDTQLNVSFYPFFAGQKNIDWSSDMSWIASVSDEGVVRPVNVGNAWIFATTEDGKHNARCNVEVVNPTISWDGGTYTGEIINGVPSGYGEWTHSAGQKYSGGWKDGKWHGKGTYIHANGFAEKGYWENGIQNNNYIESIDSILKGIKFYQSGYESTERPKREYSNRFAKGSAQYISYELDLTFVGQYGRFEPYEVDVIYYYPNGSIFGRPSVSVYHSSTDITLGYGYVDGVGYWQRGIYTAEFFIEGQLIASERFEIY